MLVLDQPRGIGRVLHHLILAILVLRDDGLGRFIYSFVDVAVQASTHDLGSGLSSPENVVRPGEGFGDVAVEGRAGERTGG